MSASILNAPDWQFLTADFIDLGDADGETGAIPVLLGGANIAPVDSEVHLAIAAAPTTCLLYTSPSPRDQRGSRMPSSA